MAKPKCARTVYKKATDDQLDTKLLAVIVGLTDHAVDFPAPPFGPAALQALLDTYTLTYNAYKRGGLDQKEEFLQAKAAVLDAMDDTAAYVDTVAKGDAVLIVNAGFEPTKTVLTPQPAPVQPSQLLVTRSKNRGEVTVECPVVANADYYGLVITEGVPLSGVTLSSGQFELGTVNYPLLLDVTKARRKTLKDMKPGVMYYFYMYAGNAAGVSTLSDGISIMGV